MFFETLAVLVVTFFASVGMIEFSEWLLKNPLKKRMKYRAFIIIKANSVPEEEIEPALRSVFTETGNIKTDVFLDCEGLSEEALAICENLERRFECSLFRGEDEVLRLIREGLHTDKKTL